VRARRAVTRQPHPDGGAPPLPSQNTAMQAGSTNEGYWICHPRPVGRHATVVATGAGRSGSTMVSRILIDLGVPMGQTLTDHSLEDVEFHLPIRERRRADFTALCRQRDALYDKWGFKFPGIRNQLPGLVGSMREPRLIVTFRDLLAMSTRKHAALHAEILETMLLSAQDHSRFITNIIKAGVPTLLLSYEKCMLNPERAIGRVAEFVGVPVEDGRMAGIVKSVGRTID
jgi:hypothetical protein